MRPAGRLQALQPLDETGAQVVGDVDVVVRGRVGEARHELPVHVGRLELVEEAVVRVGHTTAERVPDGDRAQLGQRPLQVGGLRGLGRRRGADARVRVPQGRRKPFVEFGLLALSPLLEHGGQRMCHGYGTRHPLREPLYGQPALAEPPEGLVRKDAS
ncbi:hypothetical protein IPZ68_21600 [Streptomyces arenae]|nr:hypothetical protein [Streptomyces arenae]